MLSEDGRVSDIIYIGTIASSGCVVSGFYTVLFNTLQRLIMAHALKRILFTMVNDKHTAFILVARNPDSPPDLCHCHIFMAKSQTEVCVCVCVRACVCVCVCCILCKLCCVVVFAYVITTIHTHTHTHICVVFYISLC